MRECTFELDGHVFGLVEHADGRLDLVGADPERPIVSTREPSKLAFMLRALADVAAPDAAAQVAPL
jgi:hypothetical protein